MATKKLEGFIFKKTTLAAQSWLSDFPYKSLQILNIELNDSLKISSFTKYYLYRKPLNNDWVARVIFHIIPEFKSFLWDP